MRIVIGTFYKSPYTAPEFICGFTLEIYHKSSYSVHLLVCARYRELYHGLVCKGTETSNITIRFKLLDNAGRGHCDGYSAGKACSDLKFNTTKMMKAALMEHFKLNHSVIMI